MKVKIIVEFEFPPGWDYPTHAEAMAIRIGMDVKQGFGIDVETTVEDPR